MTHILAPQVWGRDDDGGGLAFQQQDIDKIVHVADHRGAMAALYTMKSDYGQAILSLCVSDRNKALLLTCEVFIPLLVDSLLLDPAHPRINDTTLQGKSDWEGAKAPVQRVRHRLSVHHRLSVYSI